MPDHPFGPCDRWNVMTGNRSDDLSEGRHRRVHGCQPGLVSEVLDSARETDEHPLHESERTGSARGMLWAAVLPGVLLSALLTAWHYSSKPLWRDEFYTLSTAGRPLVDMVDLLRISDGGLTGFYGVMHAWLLVDGSVGWLRVPAAACTIALPALVVLVALRITGAGAAAVAGVLVAVVPAVTTHAQEARAYPLVLLATTATALVTLRLRERPTAGRAWTFAIVAALPGFLHPIVGLPAVVGMVLALLVAPGLVTRRTVVLAAVPAALAGLGLVAVGLHQADGAPSTAGTEQLLRLPLVVTGTWWAAAVLAALVAIGAVVARRTPRSQEGGGIRLLVAAWLLMPFVAVVALSLAGSYFQTRYVSASAPAAAVLAAAGLRRAVVSLRPAVAATVAGAVLVALAAPMVASTLHLRDQPYVSDDPRSAARALSSRWQLGDVVVFVGTTARGLTQKYLPAGTRLDDPLLTSAPTASNTISGRELDGAARTSALARHPRVWVVYTPLASAGPLTADRIGLGPRYAEVEQEDFGGFELALWQR